MQENYDFNNSASMQQYQNQPPQMLYQGMPDQSLQQNLIQQNNQQNMYQGESKCHQLNFLNQYESIYIQQQLNMLELLTGYEQQNRYMVYPCTRDGQMLPNAIPILFAHEKSNCCSRNCLPGSCRPFEMKVSLPNTNDHVLFLQRPCACTFLCCNRPQMEVLAKGGMDHEKIGKLVNPFLCCDTGVDVYDNQNIITNHIRGSICQLGFCCRCPCQACQELKFQVKDQQNSEIGLLKKKTAGCMKACCTDLANFQIIFPVQSSTDTKVQLLASAFFMDYMYFVESPEQKNNQ